jgi:hypothetical protein
MYKSINDKNDNPTSVFGREGAYALAQKEVQEDKKSFEKIYQHLKENETSLSEEDANLFPE